MESTPISTSSSLDRIQLDPLFQQGLQSILAPLYARNASSQEIADVTARAATFYAQSTASSSKPHSKPQLRPPSPPPTASAPTPTTSSSCPPAGEPPYPMSFAHLAALIASGAPIPGIKDIPDNIAEGEPSVSKIEVKRKPWEKAPSATPPAEPQGEIVKVVEEGAGQV